MAGIPAHNIHFYLAASLLVALLTAFGPTSAPAAAAAGGCPKANAAPGEATARELGKAVRCLVNKERAKADRKRVAPDGDLGRVARKHTKVMLEKDCLDHRCQGESPLEDRIIRSGYLDAGGRYGFAENTGCATTPAVMVSSWMKSDDPYHRKNILGKRYRDVGIGAAKGAPDVPGCDDGGRFATYTVIFGWRNRQPATR